MLKSKQLKKNTRLFLVDTRKYTICDEVIQRVAMSPCSLTSSSEKCVYFKSGEEEIIETVLERGFLFENEAYDYLLKAVGKQLANFKRIQRNLRRGAKNARK